MIYFFRVTLPNTDDNSYVDYVHLNDTLFHWHGWKSCLIHLSITSNPYTDFILRHLTSSFAAVVITMATKGRCLTVNMKINQNRFFNSRQPNGCFSDEEVTNTEKIVNANFLKVNTVW